MAAVSLSEVRGDSLGKKKMCLTNCLQMCFAFS